MREIIKMPQPDSGIDKKTEREYEFAKNLKNEATYPDAREILNKSVEGEDFTNLIGSEASEIVSTGTNVEFKLRNLIGNFPEIVNGEGFKNLLLAIASGDKNAEENLDKIIEAGETNFERVISNGMLIAVKELFSDFSDVEALAQGNKILRKYTHYIVPDLEFAKLIDALDLYTYQIAYQSNKAGGKAIRDSVTNSLSATREILRDAGFYNRDLHLKSEYKDAS